MWRWFAHNFRCGSPLASRFLTAKQTHRLFRATQGEGDGFSGKAEVRRPFEMEKLLEDYLESGRCEDVQAEVQEATY